MEKDSIIMNIEEAIVDPGLTGILYRAYRAWERVQARILGTYDRYRWQHWSFDIKALVVALLGSELFFVFGTFPIILLFRNTLLIVLVTMELHVLMIGCIVISVARMNQSPIKDQGYQDIRVIEAEVDNMLYLGGTSHDCE